MAFVDRHGRIVRVLGNRPGAGIEAFTPAVPLTGGSGPFHKIYTATGNFGVGINSGLTVPCNSIISSDYPNDSPYVYLGGQSDKGSSGAVEIGMRYNRHSNGATANNNWQPYISVAGITGPSGVGYYAAQQYENNTGFNNIKDTAPNAEYQCLGTSPITAELQFFYEQTSWPTDGSPNWFDCFGNYTQVNNYEVEFGVCPEQPNSYTGWEDWPIGDNPCSNCVEAETTSIAQEPQAPNDGSYFGPTDWASIEGSSPLINCQNYPSWNKNNDCGNGPPPGATNTVLQVSNQTLGSDASEDDIVNNECASPVHWIGYGCE